MCKGWPPLRERDTREGLLGDNNTDDCVRMSLINEEECMRIRSSFACGGIKANRRFD